MPIGQVGHPKLSPYFGAEKGQKSDPERVEVNFDIPPDATVDADITSRGDQFLRKAFGVPSDAPANKLTEAIKRSKTRLEKAAIKKLQADIAKASTERREATKRLANILGVEPKREKINAALDKHGNKFLTEAFKDFGVRSNEPPEKLAEAIEKSNRAIDTQNAEKLMAEIAKEQKKYDAFLEKLDAEQKKLEDERLRRHFKIEPDAPTAELDMGIQKRGAELFRIFLGVAQDASNAEVEAAIEKSKLQLEKRDKAKEDFLAKLLKDFGVKPTFEDPPSTTTALARRYADTLKDALEGFRNPRIVKAFGYLPGDPRLEEAIEKRGAEILAKAKALYPLKDASEKGPNDGDKPQDRIDSDR